MIRLKYSTKSPTKKRKAYSEIVNFTTPKKNRKILVNSPNSDSEEDDLDHTIIEVESPAKPSPRKKVVICKQTLLFPLLETLESQASSDQDGHISDDPSTPSSGGISALLDLTPIAEWIKEKGRHDITTNNARETEISEFESPKKSERLMANSEFYSEKWTVVRGKQKIKRNLAEEMREIVKHYDRSVRLFSHDLRAGKFSEDLSMSLIIRTICGIENRLTWTICYDINKRCSQDHRNRCIVFNPHYRQEIIPGAVLKLYQPWKEINVPGIASKVIVCADFYKVIHKPEDIGISEQFIKQLKASNTDELGNLHNFRKVPTNELKSIFLDLVPYRVKNQRTIMKQTNGVKCSVDLDIVIQTSWPWNNTRAKTNGQNVLIRDSDGLFSLLEVPDSNKKLQNVISPGTYIKFKKLANNSKITIFKHSSIFSVLSIYGSKQVFYYNLGLRLDTEWNREDLDIPFGKMDCQKKFIHEIQQIGFFEDERVAIECRILTRSASSIKVMDKTGKKIEIELLCPYGSSKQIFSSLIPKRNVLLSLVRVFHETLTLDEYSIVEEQKKIG